MRISRVYFEERLESGLTVALAAESAHYLLHVLRLKSGEPVNLFNPRDGEYACSLSRSERQRAEVLVGAKLRESGKLALPITLGLSISRGDRMDYGIQKATELGVGQICPLHTEHGDVKIRQKDRLRNKLRHWQKVAISASERNRD